MISTILKDNQGKQINLKIQPASDGSGTYVLVVHAEKRPLDTHTTIDVESFTNDRIGYRNSLYSLAMRFPPAAKMGQFARLLVRRSSVTVDYLLIVRSDHR